MARMILYKIKPNVFGVKSIRLYSKKRKLKYERA